jgi:HAMP domain-containing protein
MAENWTAAVNAENEASFRQLEALLTMSDASDRLLAQTASIHARHQLMDEIGECMQSIESEVTSLSTQLDEMMRETGCLRHVMGRDIDADSQAFKEQKDLLSKQLESHLNQLFDLAPTLKECGS